MRIIIPPPEVTKPDPIVEAGALAVRAMISPNVQYVKAGTPLRPSPLGWEPAGDGQRVVLFASGGGYGGSEVTVCREMVIRLKPNTFIPCVRYAVADIEANGYVNFKPDEEGPYTAITDQLILLTPEV